MKSSRQSVHGSSEVDILRLGMEDVTGSQICSREGAGMAYPQGGNCMETGCVVMGSSGFFKEEMIGVTSILLTIHVIVERVCNNIQPCSFTREEDSNDVVACNFSAI